MNKDVIKTHWDLIKMGVLHGYIPDQSHGAIQALVGAYGQRVDTSCGNCIFEMLQRMYNAYKSEYGE